MDNENIVSVILHDTGRFAIGESFRFCLVLLQRKNVQRDLVVGCSNITKLKQIENIVASDSNNDRLKKQLIETTTIEMTSNDTVEASTDKHQEDYISDILSFAKMSDLMQNEVSDPHTHNELHNIQNEQQELDSETSEVDENRNNDQLKDEQESSSSSSTSNSVIKSSENVYASHLMDNFNDNLLPGIGIGVLITTVFALIYAVTKITNDRRTNPATVCYAAADQQTTEIENHNRYLKLQATTSL